jgi:formylmethanofuran dehydrogenase subunit E
MANKLKFIFDNKLIATTEHARQLIVKINERENKDVYDPKPKDVAHHSAVTPVLCEECGETFWSKNRYSENHIDCKGPQKGIGF